MKTLKSIPCDVRIPILLGIAALLAAWVEYPLGFYVQVFSGLYGWVIGLVSFPMRRYRRMLACLALTVFCLIMFYLSHFRYF